MQRAAHAALSALVVKLGRNGDGIRIGLDHRAQQRIETMNPLQVGEGQRPARQLT
jgi:hypothetical protein